MISPRVNRPSAVTMFDSALWSSIAPTSKPLKGYIFTVIYLFLCLLYLCTKTIISFLFIYKFKLDISCIYLLNYTVFPLLQILNIFLNVYNMSIFMKSI